MLSISFACNYVEMRKITLCICMRVQHQFMGETRAYSLCQIEQTKSRPDSLLFLAKFNLFCTIVCRHRSTIWLANHASMECAQLFAATPHIAKSYCARMLESFRACRRYWHYVIVCCASSLVPIHLEKCFLCSPDQD